ncbi:MAG: hypothetical protein HC769_22395 [Cyanobacteria bacterium CRU_2_1]|nr:hypothetical protein [Cyanobacteria bacterium CRU_2_1]
MKPVKRNVLLEAIANPAKQPIAFIFVLTLALGVAGDGLSTLVLEVIGDWLQQQFGVDKRLWQGLVVAGLVGAVLLAVSNLSAHLSDWMKGIVLRNSTATIETARVRPLTQTYPGLIVLVSLGQNPPAKAAILHHWQAAQGNLQHCWLICGGDRSLQTATTLVEQLVAQGLPRKCFHYGRDYHLPLADRDAGLLASDAALANDPNFIRELIDRIYADAELRYGLDATEVIADYTGGNKSMSAGMILACTTPNRHLQYILSDYDDDNKPINSQVMEVQISYTLKPLRRQK